MPLTYQNGLLIASSFHLVANDQGPIGTSLRVAINALPLGDTDAVLFVSAMGSLFMQLTAILQMPDFLGPSFNPFNIILAPFELLVPSKPKAATKKKEETKSIETTEEPSNGTANDVAEGAKKKKRRRRKKKIGAANKEKDE
eukprot:CAMPEP_0197243428 /NCGR_PEP_ID=MMETSP1429-20130617/8883_1 /TAXON_ID=49237 /ORGANISM="Chaetoceros  sp., Strain UNC1202" /LENGTH=141 /DNA_ID=CAMNT_0042703653 /DNA_START=9 /DNA_END=434 /DNA_ORIENTATION=+